MRASLLGIVALVGCAPHVFWSGHTADRRHTIEIVERGGYHYAVFDGRRDRAYEAIAGASIATHGAHVAFAARRGKRWYVVADRRDSEPWDGIGAIAYGPSGRLAYLAERGGSWRVVVDGVLGPPFAAIHGGSLAWTTDGAHLAYAADDPTDHAHVVLDTTLGPAFDAVTPPAFSGPRVVYAGRHADLWEIALARVPLPDGHTADAPPDTRNPPERPDAGPPIVAAWSAIESIAPSPTHVAYAASDGTAWHVVIDDDPGPTLGSVRRIAWDLGGTRVAWLAHANDADVLALDRTPILVAPHLRDDAFGFSPTGAFVYIEPTAGGERLVIADSVERFATYAAIGARAWSGDGKHLAYVATRSDRTTVVVADGRELAGGTEVGAPVWSPLGALAYVARRDRRAVVVVAGRAYPFDLAFEDSLAFSTSGTHWCVIAGDLAHERLFFVVDGTRRIPLASIEVYASSHADLRAWALAEAERAENP